MSARWQGKCLWAVMLMALCGLGHAQSVTPEDEYKNLIQVDQAIHPLGAHPFGENCWCAPGFDQIAEDCLTKAGVVQPGSRRGFAVNEGGQSKASTMVNPSRASTGCHMLAASMLRSQWLLGKL